MRRPAAHESQGIFVAEGTKVVRRLLESHFAVVSVVLPEKWLDDFRPLLEARPEPITVYLAEKKFLETLVGFSMFQGVLAVGKIPPPVSLDDILIKEPEAIAARRRGRADERGKSRRARPQLRRVWRSSADCRRNFQQPVPAPRRPQFHGHDFSIARHRTGQARLRHRFKTKLHATKLTLAECLKELRARGIRCIAAHPHTDKKFLSQADFTRDCCIVFGSEGDGISAPVLQACDEAVAIPMPPMVDSLNVGAAAAVFLYETARQRGRS